jgi:RNA polymerase sigma factor (sigma-70 family)
MSRTPSPGDPLESAADEDLVRLTLRGDERAFARLVPRYLRKAMAVALTYVESREDAEDVVQTTFQRAYQSLTRFDPSRDFKPWFFTILRNTARDAQERSGRARHEEISEARPSNAPTPIEDATRGELRSRIEDALSRLPPMQRACFQLCMVEGFSSAEAASAVGLAESTVRVHVFRARRALKGLLEGWRE